MWKAERFEASEQKDPLEQMLDFVNAHHLLPGQFQFAVAVDEKGFQYCIMLYSEEKPAAAPPQGGRWAGRPPVEQAGGPSRFRPPAPPAREGGRGPRGFQAEFGPPGGGRGRPGGGGRPGRPGGPPRGGGRPGGGGGSRPPRRSGGPKRGR